MGVRIDNKERVKRFKKNSYIHNVLFVCDGEEFIMVNVAKRKTLSITATRFLVFSETWNKNRK